MGAERTLDEFTMDNLGTRETFRGTEDEDGPARFYDGVPAACCLLDNGNLCEAPFERCSEVVVEVWEVGDDADLVAVAGEEGDDFLVVHGSEDGAFRDFEAVDVEDGEDGTRFGRVDVLEAMPSSSGGTGLCFAIAYDAAYNEVWVVHDGAKGGTECVAEFTAFVDCTRSFGVDVAGESTRNAEASDELLKACTVAGVLWKEGAEGVFEPETGKNCGCSVTGTDDQEGVETRFMDDSVEVCIY